MIPEVAFWLNRLALEKSAHLDQGRKNGGDQADIERQIHGFCTILVHQHSPQFLRDPLGRDDANLTRHRPQRVQSLRLDLEVESRRKAHRPQEPQLVLAKTVRRVSDGTHNMVAQVVKAAHEIDHLIRFGVQKHTVDREITTSGIKLRRAVDDSRRPAAVHISTITAKCGDFHLDSLDPVMANATTPNETPTVMARNGRVSITCSGVASVATS